MRLEDLAKIELPAALGLGLVVLLAARLAPELRPPLKSAVKLGLRLLAESEGEAEAGIIERLVEPTVDSLMDGLLAPPGEAAHAKVERTLRHFEHRARLHARRWAHDPAHVGRHYRRHVRHLRRRLEQAWQRRGGDRQRYERLLARLDEALLPDPGGAAGPPE
jgi:hypothetical protein